MAYEQISVMVTFRCQLDWDKCSGSQQNIISRRLRGVFRRDWSLISGLHEGICPHPLSWPSCQSQRAECMNSPGLSFLEPRCCVHQLFIAVTKTPNVTNLKKGEFILANDLQSFSPKHKHHVEGVAEENCSSHDCQTGVGLRRRQEIPSQAIPHWFLQSWPSPPIFSLPRGPFNYQSLMR